MDAAGRHDSDHELVNLEQAEWSHHHHAAQSLPRVDGGKDAWLFLAACFLVEALVWGFPFAFGVFQVYYSSHEPFASQLSGIAAIGTSCTGIMYFAAPLVALASQRWPQSRRVGMYIGLVIIVAALLAASFCDSVSSLLATQGVMYGLGGLLVYFPAVQFIDEWFVAKRGFAYGIMWAGTGCSGIAVPFLLEWLLDTYGFRTTLRAWAVVVAVFLTPCLFLVKGRLPTTSSNILRPNDLSFLKRAPFWVFELGTIGQSLGYFLPALWIPSFAISIGLPLFAGPLALALYNLAYCFGAIGLGVLVDRYHVTVAILVATIGSMVSVFVFWGLTTGQPMLYFFAMLFGIFGGGYSATWSGCAASIQRCEPSGNHLNTGLAIALLSAGKGIGAVIAGPLSTKLVEVGWRGHASFAYGSGYGLLIIFTGVSTMLGGTACIGRLMKLI